MKKTDNKTGSKKFSKKEVENKLLAFKSDIENYLNTEIHEILPPGYFLRNILLASDIKHKTFADYIGLSSSSLRAFLNGKRKLKVHLALILQAIFHIDAMLWLNIQQKNELFIILRDKKDIYEKYSLKGLLEFCGIKDD